MTESIARIIMGYGLVLAVVVCLTWLAVTFGPIWYGFHVAKKHSDHVAKLWRGVDVPVAQTALKVTPLHGKQN